MKIHLTEGGEGSGNFGHAGRPGKVGGSSETELEPEEFNSLANDFLGN